METDPIKISRQKIDEIFANFEGRRVLVTGDVMLDSYWWGKVERISPEAPVPVVSVNKREYRLGGAANVALNLRHLGASPVLCSVIGRDMEGEIFLRLLEEEGISADGITFSEERPTTVKTRVLGNKSQLLRIDSEEDRPLKSDETFKLTERIKSLLKEANLLLFEDYDKGVITEYLISETIQEAGNYKVPIAVDPKKRNFLNYKGATLFKPNLRELAEGLKTDLHPNSPIEEIREAVYALKEKMNIDHALVTLSERGVFVTGGRDGFLIPAHIRNIFDVSGAGDTVISVAGLALLSGAHIREVAALANLAGGLVCEKVGVVPINREELYQEALREFGA
jgi:rfaE bifunctional protein kinase chain/domain